MDKEALLSIILSDIKEIETLIKSFQGKANISMAFIELTERKANNLLEELNMLKAFDNVGNENSVQNKSTPVTVDNDIIEEKPNKEAIIEEPDMETPIVETPIVKAKETIIADAPLHKEEIPSVTKDITKEVIEETTIIEVEKVIEQKPEVHNKLIEEKVQAIELEPVAEVIETTPAEPSPIVNNIKQEITSDIRLGETLQKEKSSLNDQVSHADISKKLLGKPVADLSKGLGINDRFLYQRELFNNNATLMNQTLLQLNAMPDFGSALSFLKSNFSWDNEELSNNFYNYVQRRF